MLTVLYPHLQAAGTIDAQLLARLAGALLFAGFAYIPGLNEGFASLAPIHKRLIMLALLVVSGGVVVGFSCLPGLTILPEAWRVTCDQAGLGGVVTAFLDAAIANQVLYQLLPMPSSVKAKAAVAKAKVVQPV